MMKLLALAVAIMTLTFQATPAAAAQSAQRDAPDFFEELGDYYETAGTPALAGDHVGRLAIYRTTLARLEAAPEAVRADPRYAQQHLFYSIAVAETLYGSSGYAEGRADVERLIPLARAFRRDHSDDRLIADGLARLLRVEGQAAQRAGNRSLALERFREVITLTRSLLPPDSANVSAYGLRALAIDLDNLSNMEVQAGNRLEADRSSADALALFRILAERDADSRPAQGSLLVALARRVANFNDVAALADAERQMAMMDRRGMMTQNYAPVRQILAEARRRNPR